MQYRKFTNSEALMCLLYQTELQFAEPVLLNMTRDTPNQYC
jgi:hypothetical protein